MPVSKHQKQIQIAQEKINKAIVETHYNEEDIEELIHDDLDLKSQPTNLTNIFVNLAPVPLGCCGCLWFVSLVVCIMSGYISISESHFRDFLVWSDRKTLEQDTLLQVFQDTEQEFQNKAGEVEIPERSVERRDWATTIIYKCHTCENIITVDNIKVMKQIEQAILDMKEYPSFCLGDANPQTPGPCIPDAHQSIVHYFTDIENTSQNDVTDILLTNIFKDEKSWLDTKKSFSKEFKKENLKAKSVRAVFKFGSPLNINGKKYKDQYMESEKQLAEFWKFSQKMQNKINKMAKDYKWVNIYIYSQYIFAIEAVSTAVMSMLFIPIAIIAAFFYQYFIFKSAFLAICVTGQILICLPYAFLFFGMVFGVKMFSLLSLIILFPFLIYITNDSLIMWDAWKESGEIEELQFQYDKRMALSYRRAVKSLVGPTVLKALIFLIGGFSQINIVASISVFAGCYIIASFLVTIFFFPACMQMYEAKIRFRYCCKDPQNELDKSRSFFFFDKEEEKDEDDEDDKKKELDDIDDNQKQAAPEGQSDGQEEVKKRKEVEPLDTITTQGDGTNRGFKQSITSSINGLSPKFNAGEITSKRPREVTEFDFETDAPLGDQKKSAGIRNVQQSMISSKSLGGLKRSVTGSIATFNKRKINIPALEKFFFGTYSTILHKGRYVFLAVYVLLYFFSMWQAYTFPPQKQPDKYLPEDNPVQIAQEILTDQFHRSYNGGNAIIDIIFMGTNPIDRRGISMWDSHTLGKTRWNLDFDVSQPESQVAFLNMCTEMRKNKYMLENGMTCWMEYFYQFTQMAKLPFPVDQSIFYAVLEQFRLAFGQVFINEKMIGIKEGRIAYSFVLYQLDASSSWSREQLLPVYRSVQSDISKLNAVMPKGMDNIIQTVPFYWSLMRTVTEIVSLSQMIISLSFVFTIIYFLIATKNIYLTLLGALSIQGIINLTLMVMKLLGYELALGESIAVVTAASLSIDYISHIIFGYSQHPYPDRYRRTQHTLKDMGISILKGVVFIIINGFIIQMAPMVLFSKVGVAVIYSGIFSFLISVFFLPATLFAIGPQKTQGRINLFFNEYTTLKEIEAQLEIDLNDEIQHQKDQDDADPIDETKRVDAQCPSPLISPLSTIK